MTPNPSPLALRAVEEFDGIARFDPISRPRGQLEDEVRSCAGHRSEGFEPGDSRDGSLTDPDRVEGKQHEDAVEASRSDRREWHRESGPLVERPSKHESAPLREEALREFDGRRECLLLVPGSVNDPHIDAVEGGPHDGIALPHGDRGATTTTFRSPSVDLCVGGVRRPAWRRRRRGRPSGWTTRTSTLATAIT